MPGINLLPIDLSPKRGSVKTSASLRKMTIILVGIFLLTSLIGIIVVVFLSIQISGSVSHQKILQQNISSLEGTEQKLFLVKDRIDKIKTAQNDINAADSFSTLNKVLTNLPSGISVSTVQIDTAQTKFSVLSNNSLDMASFLNSLVTNGTYKDLILTNFAFSPSNGYAISLQASL